jgi:hypothetical protein
MSTVQATNAKKTTIKRKRPEVQVVTCASSFPISKKPPRGPSARAIEKAAQDEFYTEKRRRKGLLDWNDTAKEVRSVGAKAFVGKQKRNYQEEHYKLLTGRDKKRQAVPLPIVRGIKKKAAERLEREIKEAKEAGLVIPASKAASAAKRKEKNTISRVYGPAPSIGFMKKGVFSVKGKQN